MNAPEAQTAGKDALDSLARMVKGFDCLIQPHIGNEILESAREEMATAVEANNISRIESILNKRQKDVIRLGDECRDAQAAYQAHQEAQNS